MVEHEHRAVLMHEADSEPDATGVPVCEPPGYIIYIIYYLKSERRIGIHPFVRAFA